MNIVVPVKHGNAVMTADAIMNYVFLLYGIPNILHYDQVKTFNNRLIDKLINVSGVKQTMSTHR